MEKINLERTELSQKEFDLHAWDVVVKQAVSNVVKPPEQLVIGGVEWGDYIEEVRNPDDYL